MMLWLLLIISPILIIAFFYAAAALIFRQERIIEEKLWVSQKPGKFGDIGAVKHLSILPLIDYYTDNDDDFTGEAGVSYLITADDKKILFDTGLNARNEHPSPLLRNMEILGIKTDDLSYIFLSHLHMDHIGGFEAKRRGAFRLSNKEIDLHGINVFSPEPIAYPTATIEIVACPKIISEGIASLGPISRALWLSGLIAEQALAVNVEGKGLVLIVGCGHQSLEKILKRTRDLFDLPVYGLVGGLHYPATASRQQLSLKRIIGAGKLPCQDLKSEVEKAINILAGINPGLVGLSAHDSCDWTLDRFRKTFEYRYREVAVGRTINI